MDRDSGGKAEAAMTRTKTQTIWVKRRGQPPSDDPPPPAGPKGAVALKAQGKALRAIADAMKAKGRARSATRAWRTS
jgi:hypothetical protein